MVTPAVRREALAHPIQDYEVSQRRACEVLGAARSVVRYVRQRADAMTLRSRLRELAHERKRFGNPFADDHSTGTKPKVEP
jgi:putative transposase